MQAIARKGAGLILLLSSAWCAGSDGVPGILPSGFGQAVDRDVQAVREATAPFHSLDLALAAGYLQQTDCIENPPEGAMGYHFAKHELHDAVLEVDKPEVLVYEKRVDGSFKFNGVEYIVPFDHWKHSEPPTLMGQPLKRFERGRIYYLHVWIWEPSPSGLFADWNPNVKCKRPPM